MTKVRYHATKVLPPGVPAAVIAAPGRVVVLVDERLTAAEVCAALTPLITAHAADFWAPRGALA